MKDPKNDQEEKKLPGIILAKLEEAGFADDAWKEDDLYESSYAQMGYKRYLINKKSLGTYLKTNESTEGSMYRLSDSLYV